MPAKDPAWSKEHEQILTDLWEQGFSGSEIADVLIRSRNEVLGKARRMKLPRRKKKQAKSGRTPGVRPRGRPRKNTPPPQPAEAPELPIGQSSFACTLVEVQLDQCMFILDDGHYCGARPKVSASYCQRHADYAGQRAGVSAETPAERERRTRQARAAFGRTGLRTGAWNG